MAKPKLEFAGLPNRAVSDSRFTTTHFRILAVVATHDRFSLYRKAGQGCWASNRTLAAKTGVNYNNLSTAINELAKWGYLTRETGQQGRRILRVIYEPDHSPTGEADTTEPPSPVGETGPQNTSPRGKNGLRPARKNNERAQGVGAGEYIPTNREDILQKQRRDSAEAAPSTSEGVGGSDLGDDGSYKNLGHELSVIEHRLKSGGASQAIEDRLVEIMEEEEAERNGSRDDEELYWEHEKMFGWARRLHDGYFQ